MKTTKVKDKEFELFIPESEIDAAIHVVANKLNEDYRGLDPLFIGILNGSFMFCSDLIKKVTIPCEITFIKSTSYKGTASTGVLTQILGLTENISGRHVIMLEDIVDTGHSLDLILQDIKEKNPASLRIATLFYKPKAFTKSFPIDYVGLEIPNAFIVGYGLDYDGFGRNLPDIYKLKED